MKLARFGVDCWESCGIPGIGIPRNPVIAG